MGRLEEIKEVFAGGTANEDCEISIPLVDIDYLIERVEELEERIQKWKRVEKLSNSRADELQAEVERLRGENKQMRDSIMLTVGFANRGLTI